MDPVSIVIVDDHPAVVDGVRAWCAAADPPVVVVASGDRPAVAASGAGATADVVLFDLQLETGVLSFHAVAQLVAAERRVVVYSQAVDDATVLRCLELGVSTYLTKAEGREHLIPALHAAAHNRPYAGGYALDRHAAPGRGIHALQIELCRATYLDEQLRQAGSGLTDMARVLASLVRRLAEEVSGGFRLAEAAE